MRIIKSPEEMNSYAQKAKCRGQAISFVPTMGHLHNGHRSLIEAAKAKAKLTVVSIFVNPIQFGQGEDFSRYPKDLRRDEKMLKELEVDVLFVPPADKMYKGDFKTFVEVETLSKKLCGKTRPTHFRGVATVLAKLFNIVQPDFVFFGEKDFQQLVIVKKMVEDLNFPIKVIGLPTVREFDGLAMSSRNKNLTPKEREQSVLLFKAINLAKEEIEKGEKDINRILLRMRTFVGSIPSIRLDYVAMVDPVTLEDIKSLRGKVLVAIAATLGGARLIDNLLIDA